MRREVPLGVAVVVILVVIVIAGGIVWWLLTRQPTPEGAPPKEFIPKPPYAKGAPTPTQPQQPQ
jgi:cytoskeletal protein RodZ